MSDDLKKQIKKEITSHNFDNKGSIKEQIASRSLNEDQFRTLVALFIENIDSRLRSIEAKLDEIGENHQNLKSEVYSILNALNEILRTTHNE